MKTFLTKMSLRTSALACALFVSMYTHAATVTFQERSYSVSVIPLPTNVPSTTGCDLIFVYIPNVDPNLVQKYLCIPTDPAARAAFDQANQRFYRVDRSNGAINAFNSLNSNLFKLDGTLFQNKTENPPLNGGTTSTLESYSIPLDIDALKNADIAIIDDARMVYRTSETITSQTITYEIDRAPTSIVFNKKTIPLIGTGGVSVEYDGFDDTFLLLENPVKDTNNVTLPVRISSYFRSGQLYDQIILANNAAIPTYSGNASAVAYDGDTGDIYVLDGVQLIVFKPQNATINQVTPNSGPLAGGTAVSVKGVFFPTDAIVYFGGVQAQNIVVKNSGLVTCTTPANANGGTVDVTMTGTGIIVGSPVTLTNGYTYANAAPVAVLSASPQSGLSPLDVLFNVGASSSRDDVIAERVIDFGDGTSFTFSTDLTEVSTTHTYTGNNTFTATLTVTDSNGLTGTDTQIITVGTGGPDVVGAVILKSLVLKIGTGPVKPTGKKDSLTLAGTINFPELVTAQTFVNGVIEIYVNSVQVSSTGPGSHLTAKGELKLKDEKFSMMTVKKRGTPEGTYAFSYTLRNADLSAVTPIIPPGATRITMPVLVTLKTEHGRLFGYGSGASDNLGAALPKIAVVNVKQTGKQASLSLVRK
ncbi:MAG: PKD domain-containing protein [Planctomycetota bacterium]